LLVWILPKKLLSKRRSSLLLEYAGLVSGLDLEVNFNPENTLVQFVTVEGDILALVCSDILGRYTHVYISADIDSLEQRYVLIIKEILKKEETQYTSIIPSFIVSDKANVEFELDSEIESELDSELAGTVPAKKDYLN